MSQRSPSRRGTPDRALTLVEVIVALVVLGLLLAALLPVLQKQRREAAMRRNLRNIRGIHQSFILMSTANTSYYPGVDPAGKRPGDPVETRLQTIVEGKFIDPTFLLSPAETDGRKTLWDGRRPLTVANHSYALLQLPMKGPRRNEWRDNTSLQAVVVSDRNSAADPNLGLQSLWTGPGAWRGQVCFGGNNTQFVETPRLDLVYDRVTTQQDHLFVRSGDADAYMIHSGND